MNSDNIRMTSLREFATRVNLLLVRGELPEPQVVDENGEYPLVFALENERLAVLLRRVRNHNGFANIFVLRTDGKIAQLSAIRASDAIGEDLADNMTGEERPSPQSAVGVFVDYLIAHDGGVVVPAVLISTDGERPNARFAIELDPVGV